MGWPRRRVLLVPGSSSTGRQAAATACLSTLEALGWTTYTLDATWLGSHGWGPSAEATVRRILTVPGLDATQAAPTRIGTQPDKPCGGCYRPPTITFESVNVLN